MYHDIDHKTINVYWMLVINIMMLALIASLPYQQLFTYIIMYI